MISRIKTNLIKYFFFGNSITDDEYLRLAYLLGRFLIFLPLSLCATLVLGIYSIFRPVKIFMLRCDRSKISFIVEDLEVALRIETHNTKISGTKPALLFAVLDCDSPNRAFTAMYGRVLPFLDDDRPFFRGIIRYTLPIHKIKRKYLRVTQQADYLKIWALEPTQILFNQSEKNTGRLLEKKLFTNTSSSFIAIGVSERSYYENKLLSEADISPLQDIYTCMPEWNSYLKCCEELILRGESVVRMGQFSNTALPATADPKIVDYANTTRTEFGDIWLLANCKFVIAGGSTGIYWVASAFDKPTVITDWYHLYKTSYCPQDLYIPQLAWSRSEKKLKSLEWIFAQGDGWGHKRSLIEGDIEIVKNSPEEITEVVLEMDQRLNGTWIETDEDIELQNRFRQLRDVVPKNRVQEDVRIGADFLRRYQHLL
ncbi:MAG: TIGR04372 family glycosyltransferase [Actinomycetota bacterium]